MDRLNNLEVKIDRVQEDVSEIKVTMATNTAHLELHMARTAAVEKTNELLAEQVHLMREELKPVEKHVLLVNYTIMLIGTVFTAILTLWGIYEAIQALRS
jgi:hypothetical protein